MQAHHKRYRFSFYATLLEDLEALCVYCHARHHGKTPVIPAAWIEQERRKSLPKKQPKQPRVKKSQVQGVPKWLRRVRARAAMKSNRKRAEIQSRNDYALKSYIERMRIIVEG